MQCEIGDCGAHKRKELCPGESTALSKTEASTTEFPPSLLYNIKGTEVEKGAGLREREGGREGGREREGKGREGGNGGGCSLEGLGRCRREEWE